MFELKSMSEVIIYYHAAAGFPTNNTCLKTTKYRKLNIMARPDGKDISEALSVIRRDTERTYAEDPFGIAI